MRGAMSLRVSLLFRDVMYFRIRDGLPDLISWNDGLARRGEVAVEESRETEVDIKSPVVREKSVVEGVGAAGFN